MVTHKSITTDPFIIRCSDLVEYCPGLAGLSPEDADTYAARHLGEISRAVIEWGADQIWSEPEYSWTNYVESATLELGAEVGEVLVQLDLSRR